MNTRHLTLSIAAAAQLLVSVASAEPNTVDEAPRVVVRFAELDLSKAAGADALYQRIRSAARNVCSMHESRDPAQIARSYSCYRSAVDNAVAQVNHPRLSLLHDRALGKKGEVFISAKR